jgi:integrase
MDEIRVTVVKFPDRTNLMLRYIDPITRKQRHKSAESGIKRDAEKAAGKWEAELREGRYSAPSRLSWSDFRQRYENEVLPSLAIRTAEPRCGVMNRVEEILSPGRLSDLTAERLSYFQSKLREKGLKDSTIAGNLMHLRSVLSWAVNVGMLRAVPKMQMPTRNIGSKLMRGRPITAEEFDRLLAKVEKRRPADAERWRRYLWGLWLSGLRLEESLALTWDPDGAFRIDLSGRFPRFRIYAEAEKGHRDRLLPMTPDFAKWLLATPEDRRNGPVFNMANKPGRQWK